MVPERDVDCGELYALERRKVVDLARGLDASELATTVPATPAWSVHDVVSHLVGITADLNALEFGDGSDADAWTRAQVDARLDRTVDELAVEWEHESARFEEGLRLMGYEIGSHYVGDLLQHAADVRHALDRPRPPDDLSLAVALDFYLISFDETLAAAACSVDVSVGEDTWTLGTGATVASVAADRFELFRCLGGRRTTEQIGALSWTGDSNAIVPLVSRYPIPKTALGE